MEKKNNQYTEVRLENNGKDTSSRNPLTRQFQYEYAMFILISNLFHSVTCRSRSIDSLRLYFMELPDKSKNTSTKEDVIGELIPAINHDVFKHITFPMMHACAAEVTAELERDGSHTFVYSDGIYGFSVHLNRVRDDEPLRIRVKDLGVIHKDTKKEVVKEAALKCAA